MPSNRGASFQGSFPFQFQFQSRDSSSFRQQPGGEDMLAELLEQMMGFPSSRPRATPSTSAFQNMFQQGAQFENVRGKQKEPAAAAEDTTQTVACSLKELYFGCLKRVRLTLRADPFSHYEKEFVINVKPGWKEGTRVRFTASAQFPVPITFVIAAKPHEYFEVQGSDLVWHCKLTRKQVLRGVIIRIPLLTGEEIEVNTKALRMQEDGRLSIGTGASSGGNASVRDNQVLVVRGKGMPIRPPLSSGYGDLLVKFHILK